MNEERLRFEKKLFQGGERRSVDLGHWGMRVPRKSKGKTCHSEQQIEFVQPSTLGSCILLE